MELAEKISAATEGRGPALKLLSGLRDQLEEGRSGIWSSLEDIAEGLPAAASQSAKGMIERLRGNYTEDEWGFDEEFLDAAYPFFEFLYERYWRVKAVGVNNVPAHGRALLVSNHAGIVPWDASMIGAAIVKEHPLPRIPRFMVLNWAFQLPYISFFIRRVGGTVASPYNAQRLLSQDHLVAVFPEGVKGAGKMFKDRYRLQRFGRGGFVEIALRAGAPIVPVAVIGSEEIHPMIGNIPSLGGLIGSPYFPITPTFPWLGLLGLIPLPSRWRIEFCEPIDLSDYGPDACDDPNLIFELSQAIRETIQEKIYEGLVDRGRPFGLF